MYGVIRTPPITTIFIGIMYRDSRASINTTLKKIKSEYFTFTSDICAFNLEVLVLMIKQKLMLKASDMHAKLISFYRASVKTDWFS